jgi:bacteriocin biosynthesis cyclodehydratase domain-containing protein
LTFKTADLDCNSLVGVAEGLDLVLISDDELLIQFGTRSRPSELLRDGDMTGLLGRTLTLVLKGPVTLGELLAQARPGQESEARSLIDDLIGRGILADIRSSPVDQYLRYTFSGEPYLPDCRLALIGAGPLGARIAQNLSSHGIGKLTLLDDRPVNSLWRSLAPFNHGQESDGRRADVALTEHLSLRAECLDAHLDARGLETAVAQADFTVVALEQPDLRTAHLVNRFAIRERKPWLLATVDGNFGLIGPLFYPVETACYNDYLTLVAAATPSPAMARKHREHVLRRGVGSFFTGLPSYAEIVAGHTSLAVVHFLLRGTCFVLGRVMVIDFDRMRIDVEDVLKLPRCPVCGMQKSAYRPPLPA